MIITHNIECPFCSQESVTVYLDVYTDEDYYQKSYTRVDPQDVERTCECPSEEVSNDELLKKGVSDYERLLRDMIADYLEDD